MLLTPVYIYQGESKRVIVPITRNGSPVNIGPGSGVKRILVDLACRTSVVARYGYAEPGYELPEGFGFMSIPPGGEYFIELPIERIQSKVFQVGPMLVNITVEFDDPSFPSQSRFEEFSYPFIVVLKGVSLNLI